MEGRFEGENLDILQNIEAAIAGVYREHSELTDYQVDAALEALGRTYHRESIGGQPALPKNEPARLVYSAVKAACDWRLGRQQIVDEEGQPLPVEPVDLDLVQASLKRIRKSVQMWTRESGTRGYLGYITQFIP